MKPATILDVLYTWGAVALALLVFAIMAGFPFWLRCR